MMKRIMCITIAMVLVLSQVGVAQAVFTIEPGQTVYTAEKDMSGFSTATSFVVTLKRRGTNGVANPTSISWDNVVEFPLGANGWRIADQYIEVDYLSYEQGWGVQMYTHNLTPVSGTTQAFTGDPLADIGSQPAGLVGSFNTNMTLPLAILVAPIVVPDAQLELPVNGNTGLGISGGADLDNDVDTGYFANTSVETMWMPLKDSGNTYQHQYLAGEWDPDGLSQTLPHVEFENLADWDAEGDSYATIATNVGYHRGLFSFSDNRKVSADGYGDTTDSLVNVYIAVDFKPGTLQSYKTDSITLELYHQ